MSLWDVNIKLVLASVLMVVVASEVTTLFGVFNLLNTNSFKISIQGLSETLYAISVRHTGNLCLLYSKIRSKLCLISSIRSGQRK